MATRDTYTKQTWENLPSEETPISAERLDHIEQGIKDAADKHALKDIYDDYSMNLGRKYGSDIGSGSATEGTYNIASGAYSHAEGESNTSKGRSSHVEGENNSEEGRCNHLEGEGNNASDKYNHIEGTGNKVSGMRNHIEGMGNEILYGFQCHVEGVDNEVEGNYNHVEGCGNIAKGTAQHVSGKYNEKDEYNQYAVIVGGGDEDTYERKNIYTLDWYGNAKFAGDVRTGSGVSLDGLKSTIDEMETVSGGGTVPKIFPTLEDYYMWFYSGGGQETIKAGQNIYIKGEGYSDYWWDGTQLQVFKTGRMTYEETMTVLNATAEEV